jgi:hypothetical protein
MVDQGRRSMTPTSAGSSDAEPFSREVSGKSLGSISASARYGELRSYASFLSVASFLLCKR